MFNIFKENNIQEDKEPNFDSVGESFYDEDFNPVEPYINFDTLNAITKNFYSPEARVARMMQHAKIAAEKGSWWCSIPEVGEKEIELLKQRGLRVFKKTVDNTERSQIYEEPPYLVKYSINWSDKNTTPHDKTLVEL